jgi:hypothetical protein
MIHPKSLRVRESRSLVEAYGMLIILSHWSINSFDAEIPIKPSTTWRTGGRMLAFQPRPLQRELTNE